MSIYKILKETKIDKELVGVIEVLISNSDLEIRTESDMEISSDEFVKAISEAGSIKYPDIAITFTKNKKYFINITPLEYLQHHERVKFKGNRHQDLGTRSIKFTDDGGAFISVYIDPTDGGEKYNDSNDLKKEHIDAVRSFIADQRNVIHDHIYGKASYEDLKRAANEYSRLSDREKEKLVKKTKEVKS